MQTDPLRPHQLFLFGLLVAIPSLLILLIHPKEGVSVFGLFSLEFPSFEETFYPVDDRRTADIAGILDASGVDHEEDVSKILEMDSIRLAKIRDSMRLDALSIHFPPGGDTLLDAVFSKLESLWEEPKRVHIIHFGDSQIEGDRITDFLRHKLQTRFGGSGPGWISPIPLVGSRSVHNEYEGDWKTMAIFGRIDSLEPVDGYGPMGVFSRFNPLTGQTVHSESLSNAMLYYQTRWHAHPTVKTFQRVDIAFGPRADLVRFNILAFEKQISRGRLDKGGTDTTISVGLPFESNNIQIEFESNGAFDIHLVSMGSDTGIIVSNVGMRGQAGTHFYREPKNAFVTAFEASGADVLLFQFGGNILPYIEDEEAIDAFGKRFERSLRWLMDRCNICPMIVIGPADMQYKEGTRWVTYPYLEYLRNTLRQAAFNTGAAYWDPFEAMGGSGSMDVWTNTVPPLALEDHVHFTIEGGERMAQWLYDAIMREYQKYFEQKSEESLKIQ